MWPCGLWKYTQRNKMLTFMHSCVKTSTWVLTSKSSVDSHDSVVMCFVFLYPPEHWYSNLPFDQEEMNSHTHNILQCVLNKQQNWARRHWFHTGWKPFDVPEQTCLKFQPLGCIFNLREICSDQIALSCLVKHWSDCCFRADSDRLNQSTFV